MVSVTDRLSELLQQDYINFDTWLQIVYENKHAPNPDLLKKAWDFAHGSYREKARLSGERYFMHAIAVASILADINLDSQSIAAALLHDVLDDNEVAPQDLENEFGSSIRKLVEGVNRIDEIADMRNQPELRNYLVESDALRKMLFAVTEDVRVVLIKLAETLHNMRTLSALPDAHRIRIATQTQEIFAPLANRLGIWQIKWELEDLSFRYLEPETYKQVAKLLKERRVDREEYIHSVVHQLRDALQDAGVPAEVRGRPKHIYSIYRKMQRKGISFHELFDIRAVRILVDSVAHCYAALGIVHSLWPYIPREFDDYVATPKGNDYQSLHTAVIGPEGKTLEIQIRTFDMHQKSELGVAAHWRYKEGTEFDPRFEEKIAWLRQFLEVNQDETDNDTFLERFKEEVREDRVYTLTPKGEVINLPLGSTPIDFAYAVHSEVGNTCRGAKVNGRIVPLTYQLHSGDQIEILTQSNAKPSRDWLNTDLGYANSSRARSKIRAWFKQQNAEQNIVDGRAIIDREMHRLGVHDVNIELVAKSSRFPEVNEFLAALGRGDLTAGQVAYLLRDLVLPEQEKDPFKIVQRKSKRGPGESDVHIQGVGNLLTHLAQCCQPAPNEPIIGFITRARGVSIHRENCPNIHHLSEDEGERIIEVAWADQTRRSYPVDIAIEAYDRPALLRDVSAVLANDHVNVTGVSTLTDPTDQMARMRITLEVSDINQLSRVIDKIAGLPNVVDVNRST